MRLLVISMHSMKFLKPDSWRLVLLCLLAFGWPHFVASAAELEDVEVTYEDGRYHLTSTAYFEATQAELYGVLTNYELFTKFSSAFVQSENREADELGRPGFYTRMEGCVIRFCSYYIRQGYLELTPESDIIAVANPDLSNFKFARERWQLVPRGKRTLMIYDFEMEPDFWVPPLVGPYFVKRTLRAGGRRAINRIELLAQGEDPTE